MIETIKKTYSNWKWVRDIRKHEAIRAEWERMYKEFERSRPTVRPWV